LADLVVAAGGAIGAELFYKFDLLQLAGLGWI